jgi:phosphatidylglycerophosphate synthase
MAIYQTSCGQESCLCSCLVLDFELAKVWFRTAREYFELAKKPSTNVVPRQLLQPCKFTTLQEHRTCFQQWNVLQLWIGVISTLVILLVNFIWFLAEENELAKPSIGAIFINAIVSLVLLLFFTHLAWFSVINKQGCCCLFLFCCEGKPNLLAVALVSVLFGVLAIITGIQALGSAQGAIIIVVLIGACCGLAHGVALIYLGFEAAMVWKLSLSGSESQSSEPKEIEPKQAPVVVGAPQGVEQARAVIEAGDVKAEA